MSIADLRREYTKATLSEADVDSDPIRQFEVWLSQAISARAVEPTAMVVASADREARPSARVVLLKGVGARGIEFFTDYTSQKGRELQSNPRAAAVFYWAELERQVRFVGAVEKMSRAESAAYFKKRPRASRLAAAASRQSAALESRESLEAEFVRLEKKYADRDVPTPRRWGGFRLLPDSVEFWQGRANRLHDRIRFLRSDDGWRVERLSP